MKLKRSLVSMIVNTLASLTCYHTALQATRPHPVCSLPSPPNMLRLRPTFEIEVSCSRDDIIAKLEAAAKTQNQSELFRMHGEYGELHLPVAEHRVWSPHLSFYVTERHDQVLLLGRFAPRVDVWTTIWIFYLLMAFTAFFGFTLAYSQWALGHTAWGIWIGIVPLVLISILHIIANVGQTWSNDQMLALRSQLEETVRKLVC